MACGGRLRPPYKMASMPLLSARARSLSEGPLGRTSPRSHLLTITVLTDKETTLNIRELTKSVNL